MNKIALLVIDAQNDFCDHVVGSTLPLAKGSFIIINKAGIPTTKIQS